MDRLLPRAFLSSWTMLTSARRPSRLMVAVVVGMQRQVQAGLVVAHHTELPISGRRSGKRSGRNTASWILAFPRSANCAASYPSHEAGHRFLGGLQVGRPASAKEGSLFHRPVCCSPTF